ncbi:MAG: threonine--tRNA ligase [Aigarchaeota archaeon]|nr:threonine--tRNA ligase [Aigarchaeota archaeon]MDW8093254.1 threonine--tRNA ligase [Nitrososphaerota archaeon]
MKALQLHVDYIEFEPVRPEGRVFERVDSPTKVLVEDAVVLFTCVESGDHETMISDVIRDLKEVVSNLGVSRLVVYPYAHLSNRLADPSTAMAVLKKLVERARELNVEVVSAPFGWTKRFRLSIKAHPLAEQYREWTVRDTESQVTLKKVDRQIPLAKSGHITDAPTHLRLGRELDIFQISEVSGSGLPLIPPRGFIVRNELIEYIREINRELGFEEVWTPHLLRSEVWHLTGHYEAYRERMFVINVDDEEFVLKPMNCPAHALIYASKPRSYRDLPIAYSEFGTVYRNEQSGELTGLLRVRAITQDDGHVFLRPDQIEGVVLKILDAIKRVMDSILRTDIRVGLSTRPERYIGDLKTWEGATESLRSALDSSGIRYTVKEGEGAFYGPKIDVEVRDSLGRYWQCSTIQLDFFLPERLGLEYVDSDGSIKRPVLIHRAILGSLERFTAILLEHYNGRLPVWLSAEQVRVLPVTEAHLIYAKEVASRLSRFRVSLDVEGSLGKRVRASHSDRVPFTVVIGEKEVTKGVITVRDASGKLHEGVEVGHFVRYLDRLIGERLPNLGHLEGFSPQTPSGG